jgi:hypothetical protein
MSEPKSTGLAALHPGMSSSGAEQVNNALLRISETPLPRRRLRVFASAYTLPRRSVHLPAHCPGGLAASSSYGLGQFEALAAGALSALWPPFAVGAMAALRTPNCDYAARPGDALSLAVALVPVSDAAGRRVPARTGRRDHCRRTPPLAAAVVAPGPSAGQMAGPTARSRSRGLPARGGCMAGLARIVYAQPAPMMTVFDLMVRVLAERVAGRLRSLVRGSGWRAAGRRPARR